MVHFIKIWQAGRTTTLTINQTIHMQAKLGPVGNTSWTGNETTIVSKLVQSTIDAGYGSMVEINNCSDNTNSKVGILRNYFVLVA